MWRRPVGTFVWRMLSGLGKDLVSLDRYGLNWLRDVERLSGAWGQKFDTAFDVGANVGDTLRQIRSVFPAGRIFAFVPHPDTLAELRRRSAGLRVIELVESAVAADADGKVLFDYVPNHTAINSLSPQSAFSERFGVNHIGEVRVDCTSIDLFCEKRRIDEITVLKIDAEGGDVDVLRGAKRMLMERRIKFIYLEYNDVGRGGSALIEYDDLLRSAGFRFISSYTDYVVADPGGDFFLVANALYGLPPRSRSGDNNSSASLSWVQGSASNAVGSGAF